MEGLIPASLAGKTFAGGLLMAIVGFLGLIAKWIRAPVADYQNITEEHRKDNAALREEIAQLRVEASALRGRIEALEDDRRKLQEKVRRLEASK